MKVKKRYYVACVLMCVLALALSVGVFYLEMGFARYSKLNEVITTTWRQTSATDPETGMNTDLFITKVYKSEEIDADGSESLAKSFDYLGKRSVVDGKYIAFRKEVFGNDIVLTGEFKMGDRVSLYYKPDDPRRVMNQTSTLPYLIGIVVSAVIAVVLVILCRKINKSMKDNTFSDAAVTFMDIPMAVIIAGILLAFFAGMFIGNIQVDASYTAISNGIVQLYEAGELVI